MARFILLSYLILFMPDDTFEYRLPVESASHKNSAMTGKNSPKSNILSYTLFGERWRHFEQGISPIMQQVSKSSLYKNWTVRIYHDSQLNATHQASYKKTYGSRVKFIDAKDVPGYGDISSKTERIWRFHPMSDDTVDVFCSRDLDSDLLEREQSAVHYWIHKMDTSLLVMRDHPFHRAKIMAGMWCFRKNGNKELGKKLWEMMLEKANNKDDKTIDQWLLGSIVFPRLKSDTTTFDSYHCTEFSNTISFPTKRNIDNNFVGNYRRLWATGPGFRHPSTPCPIECRPNDHKDWINC